MEGRVAQYTFVLPLGSIQGRVDIICNVVVKQSRVAKPLRWKRSGTFREPLLRSFSGLAGKALEDWPGLPRVGILCSTHE